MGYKKGDKVYFRFAGGSFAGVVIDSTTSYTGETRYSIEGTSYPGKYFAYEKDMIKATSDNSIDDLLNKAENARKTKRSGK